jgi:hypothetical protein
VGNLVTQTFTPALVADGLSSKDLFSIVFLGDDGERFVINQRNHAAVGILRGFSSLTDFVASPAHDFDQRVEFFGFCGELGGRENTAEIPVYKCWCLANVASSYWRANFIFPLSAASDFRLTVVGSLMSFLFVERSHFGINFVNRQRVDIAGNVARLAADSNKHRPTRFYS